MLVKDVMSTPAVTVGGHQSVKDALQLMARHHLASLPVLGHDGMLMGLVGEADVLRGRLPRRRDARLSRRGGRSDLPVTVAQVMSRPLKVAPGNELAEAMDLMSQTSVKSLAVLDDDGGLVGMVSRSDVIRILARGDGDIHDEVVSSLVEADLPCAVEVADGAVSLAGLDDPHTGLAACSVATTVPGVVAVQVFT
ncbi:MAG: hypothetical protein QOF53_2894 [Nocardioidaceae bacterium]|jgi:CBS domain-containing protein|nr:hypothetical protein [Nocardioidaceae bacterium]